jgi:hypothetical protein
MFFIVRRQKDDGLAARNGFAEPHFTGLEENANRANWLWKLLFARHSQICLKVALWML